jgi:ABC-type branched-subunit amino acid transport system ATPase component
MPFLKVEGLTKSFGGLMAVHNLKFQVEEGEIVGLIGPNGSGKTTTLNLLTGFLKPDSGTITFRDVNVTGLPRHRMGSKGMARTFQLTKTFFDFTALQNVMVGRVYGREPAKSLKVAREESRQILERVGLGDKAEFLAKDLTLMQRKMLELASGSLDMNVAIPRLSYTGLAGLDGECKPRSHQARGGVGDSGLGVWLACLPTQREWGSDSKRWRLAQTR